MPVASEVVEAVPLSAIANRFDEAPAGGRGGWADVARSRVGWWAGEAEEVGGRRALWRDPGVTVVKPSVGMAVPASPVVCVRSPAARAVPEVAVDS